MKCKSLMEILAEIPDFRKAKGKRHPLSAILAMSCVAILCGARTYTAIADWGRNYDRRFIKALGFTHKKTPCIATLHIIFKNIDIELLEAKLGEWAEGILSNIQAEKALGDEAVAVDGKALRGSLKQEADINYLLSGVSHQVGLTLAQCSVDFKDGDKTNEIGAMPELLQNLVLEGRIIFLATR